MTSGTWVDEVERLGLAVEGGLLPEGQAVQQLLEYSEGGLTREGAALLITGGWRTARSNLEREMARARLNLNDL